MCDERSERGDRLRILYVFHVPPTRELGSARGIIDVAEALRARGHAVSFYSAVDAFPDGRLPRYPWIDARRVFARRARRFIRARAAEFDVIDALEGSLPYSKRQLGFSGTLMTNSAGLVGLYDDYLRYERRRWRDRLPGLLVTRMVHVGRLRQARREALTALRSSDVIRVLNDDEERWITGALGHDKSVMLLPHGVDSSRRSALEAAGSQPAVRLARQTVLFIGSWTLRKGIADIPAIVASVLDQQPGTTFHFAGTHALDEVKAALDHPNVACVRITPSFGYDELPGILSGATVLMAPSYIEGFHLGVLEALAAGIPSVAYDVPGPRYMLSHVSPPDLLMPRGDTQRMASRLVEILRSKRSDYSELCRCCRDAVSSLDTASTAEAIEERVRA